MQKIVKKSSIKKQVLIIALISAILFAGITTLAYVKKVGPFTKESNLSENTVDYDEPTDEQVEAGQDAKSQALDPGKPFDSGSDSNDAQSSSVPSGNVAVEITNEPRNDNGVLNVKTLIQEVNSSGICTLTLSKSGQQSVVETAKVQALPNSSTCQGFAVDVSKLTSGAWNLKIEYKSNKSHGSVSQTVQL